MEAFEYAIKKDIRNNPIVREIDRARQRELWRWTAIGAVFLGLLLFSAWQHFELLRHGYRIEQMEKERAQRRTRSTGTCGCEIETLKSPQRIARLATDRLHMVAPAAADAIVHRAGDAADAAAKSVVARR